MSYMQQLWRNAIYTVKVRNALAAIDRARGGSEGCFSVRESETLWQCIMGVVTSPFDNKMDLSWIHNNDTFERD